MRLSVIPWCVSVSLVLVAGTGCNIRSSDDEKKEWAEREGRMQVLDERLRALASEIKAMVGPSTCKVSSDCRLVGLGAKVCEGYNDVLIYSTQTSVEEKLLPLISEFNRLAREQHDKNLSVPSCGRPLAVVKCIENQCIPADGHAVSHPRGE